MVGVTRSMPLMMQAAEGVGEEEFGGVEGVGAAL